VLKVRDPHGFKQVVKIVYEDGDLLVANKPARMRVIPDRWNKTIPNLRDLLNDYLSKKKELKKQVVWVVHRIDADTSGLVLFALNAQMHQQLNNAFQNKSVKKTYHAIVKGSPDQIQGKIDFPLQPKKGKMQIHSQGKPSVTEYRVVEKFRDYSMLEVYPLTGRTHQIRIHLQAMGFPLAVDSIYGDNCELTISDLKASVTKKKQEEKTAIISRLTLHACELEFDHPVRGDRLHWLAEYPKDLLALLNTLRKWNKVMEE
jgi:RluA family pseudouridine synthase